jgi:hypothetical protein
MKKIAVLLMLLLIELSAFADASLQQFWNHVQTLRDDYAQGEAKQYRMGKDAKVACKHLSEFTQLDAETLDYHLQLDWINDVVDEINREAALRKRQLIYANLVDTLTGLLMDLQTEASSNGASKKEMHEALDRAMGKTSQIRIKEGMPVGKAIAWAGQGGYVLQQSGEAISLRSAESVSYGRTGQFVSNRGSSGFSSGGSSSSYSGSGSSRRGAETKPAAKRVNESFSGSYKNVKRPEVQKMTKVSQTKVQGKSTPTTPKKIRKVPAQTRKLPPPKPPKPPKPKPEKKESGKLSDYIFWIIMVLCLVAFIVMLFFMIKKAHKKIEKEQKEITLSESSLPAERLKTETIYDKALKAAAAGNYTEGIRLLTIGSLLMLEEHKVMSFKDSLTNGEYLRKLLEERKLHSIFREPMGLFDLLIYGFRPIKKNDFEKFKNFYIELEKMQL